MARSNQCLSLSGLTIGLQPSRDGDRMAIPAAFASFLSHSRRRNDFLIRLGELNRNKSQIGEGDLVYRAEVGGLTIPFGPLPSGMLWEVWRSGGRYRIGTFSHTGRSFEPLVIDFSSCGDLPPGGIQIISIQAPRITGHLHPFGYPAGGLIVYLISSLTTSLLIHASAVDTEGKGILFAGVTGTGKSTMASLWEQAGAGVIHDDRVIVRFQSGEWRVFSTPVNPGDKPVSAPLAAVFIISQGPNRCARKGPKDAFLSLMEHCVQHHYVPLGVERMTDCLLALVEAVPVYQLAFRNEGEIIGFIRSRI